jgi:hypothetical protein
MEKFCWTATSTSAARPTVAERRTGASFLLRGVRHNCDSTAINYDNCDSNE